MKKTWLVIALAPVLTGTVLWAQAGKAAAQQSQSTLRPAKSGLTRVRPDVRTEDRAGDREQFDRDAWRSKLSQSDLEQRERDFEQLVEIARRSDEVRDVLETWAKDTSQPELSWTSRLALREVSGRGRRGQSRQGFAIPEWGDLRSRFDDLQRQFGGMDSMFSELQGEIEELLRGAPHFGPDPGALPPGGSGTQIHAENFTLEIQPDGVTCRVTETVDGEKHTREYKAESMEELLEANPELREKIHAGSGGFGGSSFFGGGLGDGGGGLFRRGDVFGRPHSGEPRTDILGIACTKLPPERLKELGLEPERGLHVERTEPGTIAQILGIKRGDLIVEVNGEAVYGREDIARVLRERDRDESIAVVLIDSKEQRRTLTWNPEQPPKHKAEHGDSDKDEASRDF